VRQCLREVKRNLKGDFLLDVALEVDEKIPEITLCHVDVDA
jgi:hypothetical protein